MQQPLQAVQSTYDSERKRFEQSVRDCVKFVHSQRPSAIRMFDQIAMDPEDLLHQVLRAVPALADKSVVFVGDHDGASVLIGELIQIGIPGPAHMTLLDFDERILSKWQMLASRGGYEDIITPRLYNVFEPAPSDLLQAHDCFYTNPPYGKHNDGESAKLFVTRGIECCKVGSSSGYVIVPYRHDRRWTQVSMQNLQRMVANAGWCITGLDLDQHSYLLDDDPSLTSSFLTIEETAHRRSTLEYAGREVLYSEIPNFYGRSVPVPYPRYISINDGDRAA